MALTHTPTHISCTHTRLYPDTVERGAHRRLSAAASSSRAALPTPQASPPLAPYSSLLPCAAPFTHTQLDPDVVEVLCSCCCCWCGLNPHPTTTPSPCTAGSRRCGGASGLLPAAAAAAAGRLRPPAPGLQGGRARGAARGAGLCHGERGWATAWGERELSSSARKHVVHLMGFQGGRGGKGRRGTRWLKLGASA